MASMFYELIGRIVVRSWWARHRTQVQLLGVGAALGIVGVAYLLSKREPPEG